MDEEQKFEAAWAAVARPRDGEDVSPQLRPFLSNLYFALSSEPVELIRIRKSLEDLLQFLSAPGRSNANCWAVDLFIGESSGWEFEWPDKDLPDDLHDILAAMGESLHDTVQAPDIAENFGCLPEQLLAKLRSLPS